MRARSAVFKSMTALAATEAAAVDLAVAEFEVAMRGRFLEIN
jgi:hypothetical protein